LPSKHFQLGNTNKTNVNQQQPQQLIIKLIWFSQPLSTHFLPTFTHFLRLKLDQNEERGGDKSEKGREQCQNAHFVVIFWPVPFHDRKNEKGTRTKTYFFKNF